MLPPGVSGSAAWHTAWTPDAIERGRITPPKDLRMTSNVWRLVTLPCVLLALLLLGAPSYPALERALSTAFAPERIVTVPDDEPPTEVAAPADEPLRAREEMRRRPGRGAIVPLYASFVALQGLDVHATLGAVRGGRAREANPAMAGLVSNAGAFIALKAATAAVVIYLTEHVRARNKVGAIVLMAAVNSLYAAVVTHNYRTAGE